MLSRIESWREDGLVTDIDACFARLVDRLGGGVPEVTLAACLSGRDPNGIADNVVLLRHSYRFAAGGAIGALAAAVNTGRVGAVAEALKDNGEVVRIDPHSNREPVPSSQYVESFRDLVPDGRG